MAESGSSASGVPPSDEVELGSFLEDVDGATADRIHEFPDRIIIQDRRPAEPPVGDANADVYEMQHCGVGKGMGKGMLIVNGNFDDLPEHTSASKDEELLEEVFTGYMGLDPGHITKKTNLRSGEIEKAFRTAATWDYKGVDFFVCAIVSHGDKDQVYGTDFDRDSGKGAVRVANLVKMISDNEGLQGKPKIFIFEGSRGDQTDKGMDVTAPDQTDLNLEEPSPSLSLDDRELISQTHESIRPGRTFSIPRGADVLLVYSTPEGYKAHRDMSGSWFIQSLTESIEESPDLDFLTLLTRTNNRMSDLEGIERPGTRVKQASAFASTLMKDLRFPHSQSGGSGDIPKGIRYNMNRKGKALILNNKNFGHPDSERKGTNVDQAKIENYLRTRNFDFDKRRDIKRDLTARQMEAALAEAARADYSDYDCFVCFIMTHGADGGMVYGTNGPVDLNSLISPFNTNVSLGGKPKLFFVQACKGDGENKGVKLIQKERKDGPCQSRLAETYSLPAEADFLIAYSTVPGECAWRHEEVGSWFITALIDVLKSDRHLDLAKILTRVNNKVGTHFTTSNNLKQMPFFVSRLTKDLTFTIKRDD